MKKEKREKKRRIVNVPSSNRVWILSFDGNNVERENKPMARLEINRDLHDDKIVEPADLDRILCDGICETLSNDRTNRVASELRPEIPGVLVWIASHANDPELGGRLEIRLTFKELEEHWRPLPALDEWLRLRVEPHRCFRFIETKRASEIFRLEMWVYDYDFHTPSIGPRLGWRLVTHETFTPEQIVEGASV